MLMTKYTHKGWIGLCPVYISLENLDSPDVDPRYPFTQWLLHFSLWMFDMVGNTVPEDSGEIPIKITAQLNRPVIRAQTKQ